MRPAPRYIHTSHLLYLVFRYLEGPELLSYWYLYLGGHVR